MTEKSYSSFEDVKAALERIENAPKWKHAYWAVRRMFYPSNLRYQLYNKPKWAWQRVRRGWSDYDAYSLDYYLAGVIAGALGNIRDGHSYPTDMTSEEWEAYLDDIIESLTRYRDTKFTTTDYAEEMVAYDDAARAMHNLAYRFGDMWD